MGKIYEFKRKIAISNDALAQHLDLFSGDEIKIIEDHERRIKEESTQKTHADFLFKEIFQFVYGMFAFVIFILAVFAFVQ